MQSRPFFSIGVPTFKRRRLLKETLASVLSQSYPDFEIIVGNDYTGEVLSAETLGICDPRLRIVNHPVNLREVGNMNALLAQARGRYFTWLFDDDLFQPGFLETAHRALEQTGFPPAFFSSFTVLTEGDAHLPPPPPSTGEVTLMSGREFLRRYHWLRPYLVSTAGLFDTRALRGVVGGVEEICPSPVGLYCEYLLLVRCALLQRIAYTPAPLVAFRAHGQSWGESNRELEKYREAGTALLERCATVLQAPSLAPDLRANLLTLCKIHLYSFATKAALCERAGGKPAAGGLRRALAAFLKESRTAFLLYRRLSGRGRLGAAIDFLNFQSYCCRLIVFKLRQRGEGTQ